MPSRGLKLWHVTSCDCSCLERCARHAGVQKTWVVPGKRTSFPMIMTSSAFCPSGKRVGSDLSSTNLSKHIAKGVTSAACCVALYQLIILSYAFWSQASDWSFPSFKFSKIKITSAHGFLPMDSSKKLLRQLIVETKMRKAFPGLKTWCYTVVSVTSNPIYAFPCGDRGGNSGNHPGIVFKQNQQQHLHGICSKPM